MILRFFYFLLVDGFFVFISAIDLDSIDLQCHITTNVGNYSHSVSNVDDSLVFNCSDIGRNKSTSVRWTKYKEIWHTSRYIYTKNNITRDDAGKYECMLRNNNKMTSCSVYLFVNAPPRVTMFDESHENYNALKLNCFVNAYPKPEIFVYKDGINITAFKNIKVLNYKTEDEQMQHLVIKDNYFDENDNGNYTCVAKNKYGTANLTKTVVNKREKCPKFVIPGATTITIAAGKTVSLVCWVLQISHSSNYPFHTLDKYEIAPLNRSLPNDNHTYHINYVSRNDHMVMNYTIFKAAKNDTGIYQCYYKRSNQNRIQDCNILSKMFYLFVKEASPIAKKNIYVTITASITGALAGIGLLFLICYLRRKRFESHRFYDSMPELRWDVFVSYSSKDFLWVKELCEKLEEPPFNLTVCLHQRDWELGRTVIDNMADSVYCSFKTLVILSKHYIESSYCMQELQIAMHSELGSRNFEKERIVVIKVDDVSLKKLPRALRQKSYLDFSNNEQRKHLTTKLLQALPKRESMSETTSKQSEMCDDNRNDHGVDHDQQTELLVI